MSDPYASASFGPLRMSAGADQVVPPSLEVIPQTLDTLFPGEIAPKNASRFPFGKVTRPGTPASQPDSAWVSGPTFPEALIVRVARPVTCRLPVKDG
jgi:hypothetical protein